MLELEARNIATALRSRGLVAAVVRSPRRELAKEPFVVFLWRGKHRPGYNFEDVEVITVEQGRAYLRSHCLECDRELNEAELTVGLNTCLPCHLRSSDRLSSTAEGSICRAL